MALKILVVDDEQDILKLVKGLLEPLGVEVLGLADSREAAQRVNKEKFDGVFLDSRMPYLDGFGLAKSIRGSPLNGKVPIVMLSGANDVETMRKGFQAGITFFLSKPITSSGWRDYSGPCGALFSMRSGVTPACPCAPPCPACSETNGSIRTA